EVDVARLGARDHVRGRPEAGVLVDDPRQGGNELVRHLALAVKSSIAVGGIAGDEAVVPLQSRALHDDLPRRASRQEPLSAAASRQGGSGSAKLEGDAL